MRLRKRIIHTVCVSFLFAAVSASELPDSVRNTSFWDNWFLQFGADMTVQKPHSYPMKDALKDGTSVGVDVAVGKWFTREVGLRGRLNWENGLIDTKAKWLAPFNEPGVNHDKGGYVSFVGDIMLDLHNIIAGYQLGRVWNANVFLRAGAEYNFGCDKGSPLIGLGWGNRFRLSDKWGMYADVAYNGVSSGHTMDPTTATGVGSGSNMYFTLEVGAGVGCTYRFADRWSVYADTAYQGITSEFFSGVSWSGPTGAGFNGIWDFNVGVQFDLNR